VPIDHPRVNTLEAYYHAGWAHARQVALLREGTASRLIQAAESLPYGFGFALLDAWRPLELQAELYRSVYKDPSVPPGFVSAPSLDPATPPPHLTGGSVDLTLSWRGVPLALGTGFDEFTAAAWAAAYEPLPGRVRELRRLLYWTMQVQGFVILDCEWWHFEYGTRRWAALTGSAPLYGPTQP
jgi:zinc D-Ala-D-Ala dipeptidase